MPVQSVLKSVKAVAECIRELRMTFIERQSKKGMTFGLSLEAADNHMLSRVWDFCLCCC